MTVYYNSRHPREAVLERDLPKGLWGCLGIGTVIALAVLFGAMIGFKRISDFASAHLANPQASVPVVALAAFGLVAALFALMWRKQSALAKTWPVVPGTIKLSGLDEYRAAASDSGRRGVTMYERKVSYAYQFNDVDYTGVHGSFSSNSKTTSRWVLRLFGMDFQDGASVKVWVNPRQSVGGDAQSARAFRLAVVAARVGAVGGRVSDRDGGLDQTLVRRNVASISPNIRASRSAHCCCPAWSAIRSWRISMPVFIRPRASPCTGMV